MEGWVQEEVEATLVAYFSLMKRETHGHSINKTEAYKQLAAQWGRSWKAYERKMQNISAVLSLNDLPYLKGLVPLVNIQRSLGPTTMAFLERNGETKALLQNYRVVRLAPQAPKLLDDFLVCDPPKGFEVGSKRGGSVLSQEEIAEKEAYCKEIGRQGEFWALEYERARLRAMGREDLAREVDHVSVTKGDGLGYDILSFDGRDKELHIEVKTTAFKIGTPFIITRNELDHTKEHPDKARLYRVFGMNHRPALYKLAGCLDDQLNLDPISYRASLQLSAESFIPRPIRS